MKERVRPPQLSRLLLVWTGRRLDLPELVADADELFLDRAARNAGRARWWYRREALRGTLRAVRGDTDRAARLWRAPTLLGFVRQSGRRAWSVRSVTVPFVCIVAVGIAASAFMVQVRASVMHPDLGLGVPVWGVTLVDSAGGTLGLSRVAWRDAVLNDGVAGRFVASRARRGGVETPVGALRADMREVVPGFLHAMGVSAALGRDIEAPGEVVLFDAFWRTRFGADRDVLGRTLRIDGIPAIIVGVTPATYAGPECCVRPDLYVSADPAGEAMVTLFALDVRDPAAAEVTLARLLGERNRIREVRLIPPGASAFGGERGIVGRTFTVLLVLAFLAFLATVLNAGNLLLADTAARGREFRLRRALGAGGSGVGAQVALEAGWLALASGALAVPVIWVLVRIAPAVLPIVSNATSIQVRMGAATAWAVVGAAFGTALLCGLPAGLAAVGVSARRQIDRGRGRQRLGTFLLIAQIAVVTAISVVAAGYVESLRGSMGDFVGFRNEDTRIFTVSPAIPGLRSAPLSTVLGRLATGSALTRHLPVYGAPRDSIALPDGTTVAAVVEEVSAGYADLIGLRMLAGEPAIGATEAVLSEDLAVRIAASPAGLIGATLRLGEDALRIVGIAEAASWGFGEPRATVYRGWQPDTVDHGYLLLSSGPGSESVNAVASALSGTGVAVSAFGTLRSLVVRAHVLTFFLTRLALLFGAIALIVALAGLHAHLHRWLRTRQREMSVRYALGAAPSRLRGRVLYLAGIRIALGLGAGAVLAAVAGRVLAAIGAPSATPIAWLAALTMIAVASLLTAAIPALRPLARDPLDLLRDRDG